MRDILNPIQIVAAYHLGHDITSKRSIKEFPPLQPILQQKKEKDIIEKTVRIFSFIQKLFFEVLHNSRKMNSNFFKVI